MLARGGIPRAVRRAVITPQWNSQRSIHIDPQGPGGRHSVSGIRAAVFGATGFVGRYVVSALGGCGSQVVIPFRGEERTRNHLKVMGDLGQIVFHPWHLRDRYSIVDAIQHCNVVINLVGAPYATRNFSLTDVHVEAPAALARIAADLGIAQFVHFSALGATADSPSEIMRLKLEGERAVLREFPDATILRPAHIFGDEDRFLNRFGTMLQWLPFLPVYALEHSVQPIHVSDVASAVLRVLASDDSNAATYDLAGPSVYTYRELLDTIILLCKYQPEEWVIPRPIMELVGAVLGQTRTPLVTRDQVREAFDDITMLAKHAETNRTLSDLGIEPKHLEDEGLQTLRRFRQPSLFFDTLPDNAPLPKRNKQLHFPGVSRATR